MAASAGHPQPPRYPIDAQFPNTLPTFLIGGYQQLGSPPNTAIDFNTSVTQIADTLTWVKGRHTVKAGVRLALGAARMSFSRRRRPDSFTFTTLVQRSPGAANTGTPLASFLLGQVQTFSIDLQQPEIRNRARFQEYFVQDDWKVADSSDAERGRCATR